MTDVRPKSAFVLCVLSLLAGIASGPAQAEESPPPDGPHRTALVLFVSYRGMLPAFPDPTRVRLAGSERMAAALTARGHEVVGYPEMESPMRQWRVRSERDLGSGFLEAVASEFDADHLVVARLVVYRDRVLVLARDTSLQSGELVWADATEEVSMRSRWDDPAQALADVDEIVERAAGRLAGGWSPAAVDPGARTIVTLPLTPVGVGRGVSDLATHCILRALLDSGRWTVLDPALAVFALQREGLDPFLLEEGARRVLAARFNAETLLIPRLTAFPLLGQARRMLDEELEEAAGPSFELGTGVPFHFSLVAIDCDSGRLTSGADRYLAPEDPLGIFGTTVEVEIARRFQDGADHLVRSLLARGGN